MRMLSHLAQKSRAMMAAAVMSVAVAGSASAGVVWLGNDYVRSSENPTNTLVTARHDGVILSGGSGAVIEFDTTKPLATNYASELKSTSQGFQSNAKAGVAHNESSTNASFTLASGTSVTQSDAHYPSSAGLAASELVVDFSLNWQVDSDGLTVVSPTASIPIGLKLKPGGVATFDAKVEWLYEPPAPVILLTTDGPLSAAATGPTGTGGLFQLRPTWDPAVRTWTNNTSSDLIDLINISAPAATPYVSFLAPGTRINIQGTFIFRVDNADPTYTGGFDEQGNPITPPPSEIFLDGEAVVGVNAVPLPSAAWAGIALLGAMGGGRLLRRRSRDEVGAVR